MLLAAFLLTPAGAVICLTIAVGLGGFAWSGFRWVAAIRECCQKQYESCVTVTWLSVVLRVLQNKVPQNDTVMYHVSWLTTNWCPQCLCIPWCQPCQVTILVLMLRQFRFNFYGVGYLSSLKHGMTWTCRPQHVVGGPPGGHMVFPNAFCRQTKACTGCYSDIYICYCDTWNVNLFFASCTFL